MAETATSPWEDIGNQPTFVEGQQVQYPKDKDLRQRPLPSGADIRASLLSVYPETLDENGARQFPIGSNPAARLNPHNADDEWGSA